MLQMHDGKELVLPMVILTGRESNECEANTYQDTLAQFKGKAPKKDELSNWDAMIDAHRAFWTVFYSARTPGDISKKWFLSKEQVEDTYNWDEIGILMNDYLTIRLTQPHIAHLDVNDPNSLQGMLDTIKRMGEDNDFFLNGLTMHAKNQLLKYLVAKLETSQNTNG
jgi:hypothetical protein